jgi:AcrR family transcriptional regulator
MAAEPSFQQAVRSLLRDRILDAAATAAGDEGWARVRMADIAATVGVSRQTLYNEFGSKPALAEALVMRETEAFLSGIRAHLDAHPDDPPRAFAAAVRFSLEAAKASPLLRTILTARPEGTDELLPLLTTRSEPVVMAAARMLAGYAREHWHGLGLDDDELEFLVETIVRLTVSHIVLPLDPPAKTARRVGWLVERALARPGPVIA